MVLKRCQNKMQLKAFLEKKEMEYIMENNSPRKYPCMLIICDYQNYEYIYPEDIYYTEGLPLLRKSDDE